MGFRKFFVSTQKNNIFNILFFFQLSDILIGVGFSSVDLLHSSKLRLANFLARERCMVAGRARSPRFFSRSVFHQAAFFRSSRGRPLAAETAHDFRTGLFSIY